VLAEPSSWDAGQRLMQVTSPEAWGRVTAAANLVRDNRDAIEACRKVAARKREAVSCTIKVGTSDYKPQASERQPGLTSPPRQLDYINAPFSTLTSDPRL
jgi:hypothetical protein